MMTAQTEHSDIETLLQEGLEFYGRGFEEQAFDSWRRVLRLVPGEPRATDYLVSAGASVPGAAAIDDDEAPVSSAPRTRPWRIGPPPTQRSVASAAPSRGATPAATKGHTMPSVRGASFTLLFNRATEAYLRGERRLARQL